MNNYILPNDPEFISNLILQKTGYFLKLGGAQALMNWNMYGDKEGLVKFLEENNFQKVFLDLVFSELVREYKVIRSLIADENLDRIISIGPGNGLLELLLLKEGLTSEILLIDIENTDYHYHGFSDKGSGYADLESTKNFIELNLSTNVAIKCCNPYKQDIPDFSFSLLISLLSMGFHYPCSEYSNYILKNSKHSSLVIIDKRLSTEDKGYQELQEFFFPIHQIQSPKSNRMFLARR